jgi:hypothetical protein
MEKLINWQKRKREKLYKLLGDLPERNYPVKVIRKIEEEREKYILEKLILDLNGYELVPAYFVKPKNLKNKVPGIVFNHSHGGKYYLGKDEFIEGNSYMAKPPYAELITSLGFAGICIDHINFGERSGRDELDLYKELIWYGKVLWGLMVFDSLKTVDYLITREEIDKERIATIGMSMGSTMAWYLSALDERIKIEDMENLMEKIVSLCKRRGFIFPSSEIYGGIQGFYDYGPLGVEMKENIKRLWWKKIVQERDDVVGLDSAIIQNPNVWKASGFLLFYLCAG